MAIFGEKTNNDCDEIVKEKEEIGAPTLIDHRLKKENEALIQENAELKKRLGRAKKRDTPRGMGR